MLVDQLRIGVLIATCFVVVVILNFVILYYTHFLVIESQIDLIVYLFIAIESKAKPILISIPNSHHRFVSVIYLTSTSTSSLTAATT